ncbi:MAG: hypothetical protein J6X75_04910 [Clostridia bacterium]|nr:hypothetical protein [Clostridia bacterium]
MKKQINGLLRTVDQDAKPEHCLLCGKKGEPVCNSHIVPQFILKGISDNGMICYGQSLFDTIDNLIETKKGINNSFTFRLICRDCDQKKFATYEDPNTIINFEELDNGKKNAALIEMALKTHLAHINTKAHVYALNQRVYPVESQTIKNNGEITAYEIDIDEHLRYIKDLTRARKSTSFTFDVLYNTLLDYEVGIAAQTIIAYQYDLKGNKLFEPKDFITTNLTRYFYLVIFPYNGKTRIMFYIERKYKYLVKPIIDDFLSLSDEEKLHFLFISLIIYDEQFYINPTLQQRIKNDKKLVKLYTITDAYFVNDDTRKEIKNFRKYNNYLL